MRFSIRYKILAVLAVLLLTAVTLYTVLASSIFTEQKTALLYDMNHSIAVNTAAQLRATLTEVQGRLRLYTLSQVVSTSSGFQLPAEYLEKAHITGLRLYRKKGKAYVPLPAKHSLRDLNLDLGELDPHLTRATERGLDFWKQDEGNRFFFVVRVEVDIEGRRRQFFATAELDGKPLFKTLQAANLFESYLVRGDGQVLVHVDGNAIVSSPPLVDHPLLKAVQKTGGKNSGVSPFSFRDTDWYGAYAPLDVGELYFLSQANRTEVTAAITTLRNRSLLFGLIVLTTTFIASILFSKKLTQNLQVLTAGARQIEQGDLNSKINIGSSDEIQELAHSFNAMMDSLRASREEIEKYNRELEDKVNLRTAQLQESNAMIKEVQEKLLQATHLAAVGEVAGRTAHELLNPLTAIISRLERSQQILLQFGNATQGLPQQLGGIIDAWEKDYKEGGLEGLAQSLKTASSVKPGATLFEEDLGNLRVLAKYWDDENQALTGDLNFVQEQSQRIHRIVDKMREMARSSTKEDVPCHDALNEALLTMKDFLDKHDVKLESDLQATADVAHLNRDEFIQIFTNMIRNSYQAISAHSDPTQRAGRIIVRTRNEGRALIVEMEDSGVGIAPDKHARIFDQGFTTKGPSEGTGLGLAICRRYARAFGGEVELVESAPGKTLFRITVPLKEVPQRMAS